MEEKEKFGKNVCDREILVQLVRRGIIEKQKNDKWEVESYIISERKVKEREKLGPNHKDEVQY